MSLPFTEMNAITDDYYMLQGGKAVDIYYNESWLLNRFMKEKVGLWERPASGERIKIPFAYDVQLAGTYSRGGTLDSTDREAMNAAYFDWKFYYSNATVMQVDLTKNEGPEGKVKLITNRIEGAQNGLSKKLANDFYATVSGAETIDSLFACCNETSTLAYGGFAEDDLVSSDGTKPWEGKMTSTSEGISGNVIRTLLRTAKIKDGKDGKPSIVCTTDTLFDKLIEQLQVQQQFVKQDEEMAKAGFAGVTFDFQAQVYPDMYMPSGYAFALNPKYIGFAVHKDYLFSRTKWEKIPDSAEDKTMKIYWTGNLVVNNRKAHIGHSNLS